MIQKLISRILVVIFFFGLAVDVDAQRKKKKKKKYVLSGSFNLTNTPEESLMYGTFSIEEN